MSLMQSSFRHRSRAANACIYLTPTNLCSIDFRSSRPYVPGNGLTDRIRPPFPREMSSSHHDPARMKNARAAPFRGFMSLFIDSVCPTKY